jgi:chemotaxis protein CheD
MNLVSTAPPLEKESLVLGMGDMAVTTSMDIVLTCIGLGSCIAVCAYDRLVKLGGMVHVVLPEHHDLHKGENRSKFADTAVPLLVDEMMKNGASRQRLLIKIAGGAQMTVAPGLRDTFKTGERNLAQIILALQRENIALAAADVGGNLGRTVRFFVETGKILVKTVNGVAAEL